MKANRMRKVGKIEHKRGAKPGFALLLVLIITAIGVVLGMSYLSVASINMQISKNYLALSKARYLAESGLEHGIYILRFWPEQFNNSTQRPLGPYQLDNTSNYYNIWAIKDTQKPGQYILSAMGVVGNARKTSSITVYRSSAPEVKINHGVFVKSGGMIWLPLYLTINADIHTNGSIFNLARINGNVSAAGTIIDPLHRINGLTYPNSKSVDYPNFEVRNYIHYRLNMVDCYASTYTNTIFGRNNPFANGNAITPNNLGGVVHLVPRRGHTVRLTNNLNFTGTLVINGDLILDGRNITLTAVQGFPAIVTTGTVKVTNFAKHVTINGNVIAKYGIAPSGRTRRSSTTINGLLISNYNGYKSTLRGKHTLNYTPERSVLYDFTAGPANTFPQVSLLNWND